MLHEKFSNSFVVYYTYKTILFHVWYLRCSMSLEVLGLILLTMFWFTSASVLVLLSRDYLMIFLAGIFVGMLTFIFSIMMVECISKVSVDNRFNH